jgi:hypothetical protein
MKKSLYYSIIILLWVCSINVYSDISKTRSEMDQLKVIRSISQSILKIRGEKRKIVWDSTREIRKEIDDTRDLLLKAVVVLDRPTMTFNKIEPLVSVQNLSFDNTTKILGSKESSESGFMAKFSIERMKKYFTSKFDSNETVELANSKPTSMDKNRVMFSTLISDAKGIAVKRKAMADEKLPVFWQVWKKPKASDVDVSNVFGRIAKDIDTLSALDHIEKKNKLKNIIMRLENSQMKRKMEMVPAIPAIPTVSTMTKHYRRTGV